MSKRKRDEDRPEDPKATKRLTAALTGRTGGVYVPPHKLARLRQKLTDKTSETYQRMSWETLRKGINGLINKVNIANIKSIIPDLFRQNLVRGKGLFARALMKAQMASPGFSHIYCALLAVVNTKMPENGELVVKRVIMQFRRSYKRNDKVVATALAKFIGHLVNQQIAHELIALQLLALLLEKPTDDSVEVAVNFTKEVGQILMELSPKGLEATFKRFRGILHEGEIDKRAQYTIEGLFTARRSGFKDYPAVHPELDLVETEDQITHEISLSETNLDKEEHLDVFHFNDDFEKNEQLWGKIRNEILDEDESSSSSDATIRCSSSEADLIFRWCCSCSG